MYIYTRISASLFWREIKFCNPWPRQSTYLLLYKIWLPPPLIYSCVLAATARRRRKNFTRTGDGPSVDLGSGARPACDGGRRRYPCVLAQRSSFCTRSGSPVAARPDLAAWKGSSRLAAGATPSHRPAIRWRRAENRKTRRRQNVCRYVIRSSTQHHNILVPLPSISWI